jgi:peptidoglycan biosynthesis protein MviN/MurJ (putative lipid II flippase)/O-antigen ligase
VLEANVLPAVARVLPLGRRALNAFVRRTVRQAVLVSGGFYLLAGGCATYGIFRDAAWTPWQRHAAATVVAELAVLVLLTASNSVRAGALYALDDFLGPTITQAFKSLVPLCALAFLGRGAAAIELLALFMVAGEFVRACILGLRLHRRTRDLAPDVPHHELPTIWRAATPHAVNMIVLALNPVIDRAVAASLRPGSVTVLDLGEKVFYVPVMILTSSVILVAGARWSMSAVGVEPAMLHHDFLQTLRRGAAVSVALALVSALVLAAGYLAIGRDVAGAHARSVVLITFILLIGLPPAIVATLAARLLISMRRTAAFPALAAIALALNVGGDVIGARVAGLFGIAAATVGMRVVVAVCFTVYCLRVMRLGGAAGVPRLALSRIRLVRRYQQIVTPARALAAASAAVLLGCIAASEARLAILLLAGLAFGLIAFRVPLARLPALALIVFAVVPSPYLLIPRAVGPYLSLPVLFMLVYVVRSTVRPVSPQGGLRSWPAWAIVCILGLGAETLWSIHPSRSVAWSATFLVTVPLVGAVAARSDHRVREELLRAWVAVAGFLGAFGVVEGLTHYNPFAKYYFISGVRLSQTWSVYRIETLLGHPLFNALFFSTSAAVITILAVRRPTVYRVVSAALCVMALTFTASRGGALGLVLGVGAGLIGLAMSRFAGVGRKALAISTLVIALVLVWQSPVLRQRDQSAEGQANAAYRTQVLDQAVALIRADHYLGSGPGTSERRFLEDNTAASTGSGILENSVLGVGVSTGIGGLAVIAAMVLGLLATAVRRQRWEVVAGVIAFVVSASGFNVWDEIPECFVLLGLLALVAGAPEVGAIAQTAVARATRVPIRSPRLISGSGVGVRSQ